MFMAKLAFFDCNCSIGRVPYPLLMDISDAQGLRREMDTAGIPRRPHLEEVLSEYRWRLRVAAFRLQVRRGVLRLERLGHLV